MANPLLIWTEHGLYCEAGGFYIDPLKPRQGVDLAIVTHAHSDHARLGAKRYLCADSSRGLMKTRLGAGISVTGVPFGERLHLGSASEGVKVSLHPAGHILGSAQVRIERGSEVWVVSGDYKREPDPSCEPFEIVPCDVFITEATFGTPHYAWEKSPHHGRDILEWWKQNAEAGKNSLLFGYSLGKSQRILAELADLAERPVLIHSTIAPLADCYRAEGRRLAPTIELDSLPRARLHGELVLAPPSVTEGEWLAHLGEFRTAFASGWMADRRSQYDHGFVMSDHADWNDLNRTIQESGAKQVFVLHRGNGSLVRHLRKLGLDAHPVSMLTRDGYPRRAEVNLSLF